MADATPPPRLPPELRPVTPVLARRGDFVPTEGATITITLPGEIVRAQVMELLSRDVIVVEIKSIVVDKSGHGFKTGSHLACKRGWNGLSEIWEPVSDREVREREAIDRVRAALEPEPEDVPRGTKRKGAA